MKAPGYKELFEYLVSMDHPLVPNLKRGVTPTELKKAEEMLGRSLPPSLRGFFSLYDGVNKKGKPLGELSLFPNGMPFSLHEAVAIAELNKKAAYWPFTYFPLFQNGEGDVILVQLADGEDEGRVYYYSTSNISPDGLASIYDSELSMIHSIISCYRAVAYSVANGYLEVDFQDEARICKRLNPESDYWELFDLE